MTTFRCVCCGEEHDLASVSPGFLAPAQWDALSESERAASLLTADQCVLVMDDGSVHYLLRACLDVPVRGRDAPFGWGVWCP